MSTNEKRKSLVAKKSPHMVKRVSILHILVHCLWFLYFTHAFCVNIHNVIVSVKSVASISFFPLFVCVLVVLFISLLLKNVTCICYDFWLRCFFYWHIDLFIRLNSTLCRPFGFCLSVCLFHGFRPTRDFSLIWRRQNCRWKATNFWRMLGTHGHCTVPHLRWLGTSVIAKDPRHSHMLPSVWQRSSHYACFKDLGLLRQGIEHQSPACQAIANPSFSMTKFHLHARNPGLVIPRSSTY